MPPFCCSPERGRAIGYIGLMRHKTLRLSRRPWSTAFFLLVSTEFVMAQAREPLPALDPHASALSEAHYLMDMPIVLSVSRMPQRLDETPGAVTILDRDMIRLSGGRDVADLLRLVPGFQTSTAFESGAPLASYHGGFEAYSGRIQVLVDGRSVYSPYFSGGTATGLQTVALADIERIEVLRGSNSASYGARAMLGVINIVTRHSIDTLGGRGTLAHGENGIRDAQASIGWGRGEATMRLGLDRRADDGLSGSNGHNQINRLNFRADLRASARDEIALRAGGFTIDSGKGFASKEGDPPRERSFGSGYAQLDWRHSLGADEDVALSFSHTQEKVRDGFAVSLLNYKTQAAAMPDGAIAAVTQWKKNWANVSDSIDSNVNGHAASSVLSLQHTLRHSSALRVVLGGELRREQVVSQALYNTQAALRTDYTRLFGNAEWRFADNALLNAGGMYERNSISGDSFSPRLMVNWHLAQGQTLRVGVSKAHRSNSTFEQFADVRYVSNDVLLKVTALASGNVKPERLLVRELGYFGEFARLRAAVDVRLFQERLVGFVRGRRYELPAGTSIFPSSPWDYRHPENFASSAWDYVNAEDFTIEGLEYQLKWRPWRDAQLIFNQAYIDIQSVDQDTLRAAPKLASTLIFSQKLPGGLDLSLTHQENSTSRGQGTGEPESARMRRTDLRLGVPLRAGRNRGELALVLQNLGSPYQDFAGEFEFQRRAFVTLQLEN